MLFPNNNIAYLNLKLISLDREHSVKISEQQHFGELTTEY